VKLSLRFVPPRLSLVVALALAVTLLAPVASPAHGAGPRIAAFYPITNAAFNAWNGGSPPPRTSTFAVGVATIGYYLDYTGATPGGTHIQVYLRDPSGNVVRGAAHVLHHVDGSFADVFDDDPGFPPGTYTYGLLLNGKLVASAHFKVTPGLVIPVFYTATRKAIDAWQNSATAPAPARTAHFPSGASTVGYYFSFIGVTPGVTTFRCTIYDATGNVVIQGDLHTLHHVTGYFGNYFYDTPSFSDGHYRLTLRMKGLPPRSTEFDVGG
jgi:hypothetical protein